MENKRHFIMVNDGGNEILLNTDWIENVLSMEKGRHCRIALSEPSSRESVFTDESFHEVCEKLRKIGKLL